MKNIVNFMTFSSIFIVLIVGCSAQELEKVTVEFKEENQTLATGKFHTYQVNLADESGDPFSADDVSIYMNMERMNHPMQGTMQAVEEGKYTVDLPLAMEGEWYAEVTVTYDNEETTERFSLYAEGDMAEEYMKGYDADTGEVPQN